MVCALKRAVPPLLHSRLAVLDPKLKQAREAGYHQQADAGNRPARHTAPVGVVASSSSAWARSSISEMDGGFSRLQPRRAFASPAMKRWSAGC